MNISEEHLDTLKEFINIGVGRGASVLNELINQHVTLKVTVVKILNLKELKDEIVTFGQIQNSFVTLPFKGIFSGSAVLIFPSESALKLITLLTGKENIEQDIDSIKAGTLCEIGNIVLGAVMGTLSNLLDYNFKYIIPSYYEDIFNYLSVQFGTTSSNVLVFAQTNFLIKKELIEGNTIIILEVEAFDKLLQAIDSYIQKK